MLQRMPEAEELQPVPDAHVPVMKFKFRGISIDLLYAQLSQPVIPEVSSCTTLSALLRGVSTGRQPTNSCHSSTVSPRS